MLIVREGGIVVVNPFEDEAITDWEIKEITKPAALRPWGPFKPVEEWGDSEKAAYTGLSVQEIKKLREENHNGKNER